MARILITIEYDGTGLVGWQTQDSGPSVQASLEHAAERLTGEVTAIFGAGRTDAGVHATGQAAHLDVPDRLDARSVQMGLNALLRTKQVRVIGARRVADDFHARFDATQRRYLYRILCQPSKPALDRDRVWHNHRPLDAAAMAEAASYLLGRHDFTSFRAAACQADNALRTLDRLDVFPVGTEIHIVAAARSFLHHQVRNITGSLVHVGTGKWQPEMLAEILAAKDRAKAGPKAPATGLYLTGVSYPDSED